jgi:hypothetical protein
MRRTAPVYTMKAALGAEPFLITRYNDVVNALKDPRFFQRSQKAKGSD